MVDMMIDTMVDNNRYNGWPKRATSIACIYPNVRSTRRLMIYTIPGRCCCRSPFSSLISVYTWYAIINYVDGQPIKQMGEVLLIK